MEATLTAVRLVSLGGTSGPRDLTVKSSKLVLSPSPQLPAWEITSCVASGQDGWYQLFEPTSGLRLDLENPEQQPVLAHPADVSGQHWKIEAVPGGYKLWSMWAGSGKFLTAEADKVSLIQSEVPQPNQTWEIRRASGEMWTVEPPPEIIACDFGGGEQLLCGGPPEPEIIACDFGGEPQIIECELEGGLEIQEAEIMEGEVMLCGGLAPPSPGGPVELLQQVRAEAERSNGAPFSMFEPVQCRSQVVAGTNHHCKVQIGEGAYAHLTIFEPLPGQGPPVLSNFVKGKTLDDPIG